jgi:hypothetical protein
LFLLTGFTGLFSAEIDFRLRLHIPKIYSKQVNPPQTASDINE